MNKLVAAVLLVGGAVLVVLGINAMNSFGSDVSRFFTGAPTDKAVWMLLGGAVVGAAGLTLMFRGTKPG